ncbi:hypothetical protein AKJ16_DCAP19538 [Drosera capensis]
MARHGKAGLVTMYLSMVFSSMLCQQSVTLMFDKKVELSHKSSHGIDDLTHWHMGVSMPLIGFSRYVLQVRDLPHAIANRVAIHDYDGFFWTCPRS